jgi:hypothetical protein
MESMPRSELTGEKLKELMDGECVILKLHEQFVLDHARKTVASAETVAQTSLPRLTRANDILCAILNCA